MRDGEGGCVFASELVSPMNSSNLQAAMSREHHEQKEVSVLKPYRWPLRSKRYGRAHDVRAAIDSTTASPKAGDRHPPAGLGSVCHWPEDMRAQPARHCVFPQTIADAAQCTISSTRQATHHATRCGTYLALLPQSGCIKPAAVTTRPCQLHLRPAQRKSDSPQLSLLNFTSSRRHRIVVR